MFFQEHATSGTLRGLSGQRDPPQNQRLLPTGPSALAAALRFYDENGGIRVLYFWYVSDDAFYMLFA